MNAIRYGESQWYLTKREKGRMYVTMYFSDPTSYKHNVISFSIYLYRDYRHRY